MSPPVPRSPPTTQTWTAVDGYPVHGRTWPPPAESAGTAILYLHGIQSHGGWFEWSAARLAHYAGVLLPDRRGSGTNAPPRGDVRHRDTWLRDIDTVADWARANWRVKRFAVVGVSWGAKLAVAWALRRPDAVEHVLLIAPGLFPAVNVGLGTRLRIGWALLRRPERRFAIPLSDPALFTDHPPGRAFIAADALKLTHATARFLYESSRLDRTLRTAPDRTLHANLTVFLAERERIIANAPTRAWATRIASAPTTIHEFRGACHTLELEGDVAEFGRALDEWGAAVGAGDRK